MHRVERRAHLGVGGIGLVERRAAELSLELGQRVVGEIGPAISECRCVSRQSPFLQVRGAPRLRQLLLLRSGAGQGRPAIQAESGTERTPRSTSAAAAAPRPARGRPCAGRKPQRDRVGGGGSSSKSRAAFSDDMKPSTGNRGRRGSRRGDTPRTYPSPRTRHRPSSDLARPAASPRPRGRRSLILMELALTPPSDSRVTLPVGDRVEHALAPAQVADRRDRVALGRVDQLGRRSRALELDVDLAPGTRGRVRGSRSSRPS